jgi:hypothetical protein
VKVRFPKPAPLSVVAQSVALRKRAPFGITSTSRHRVNWRGTICPSEFGRNYTVELDYMIGGAPKVWVRRPDLKQLSGGRRLPHVYDQKTQRLCLYLPGCRFWRPSLALACTMVPWTSLWLYNFEIWLVTDVWHTAGEHPDRNQCDDDVDRSASVVIF